MISRIGAIGARSVRACAYAAVAMMLGCTAELEQEAGSDDDVGFRADGCGAGLQKGTATQTCKYKPKLANVVWDTKYGNVKATGTCDGDSKIKCELEWSGCNWEATASSTCVSGEPQCEVPAMGAIKLSQTVTLSTGDTTCDPAKDAATLAKKCLALAPSQTINGQYPSHMLEDKCRAMTKADVSKEVTCCIKKPDGGSSSGGESGGGCESGSTTGGDGWTTVDDSGWTSVGSGASASAGPTGDDSVGWTSVGSGASASAGSTSDDSGWTSVGSGLTVSTSDDSVGWTSVGSGASASAGSTSDDSFGSDGSDGSASGGLPDMGTGGDGCPPGTTWQCTGGDGPIVVECACAVAAL